MPRSSRRVNAAFLCLPPERRVPPERLVLPLRSDPSPRLVSSPRRVPPRAHDLPRPTSPRVSCIVVPLRTMLPRCSLGHPSVKILESTTANLATAHTGERIL